MAAETVRIEIPIETIDETEPELSNVVKKLTKMGKAVDEAGNSTEKARKKVSKFDATAEKTQKSLSKWAKEKYQILLEAKERITPVLRTLGTGIRNIAGKTWRVTMRAVDLVTAPVRGIINLLKNPIFQVGAVLGVSIGLKDTIDTYKGFEAAMSQVSAISGATGNKLDKLSAKAQEMGATTKFTATEAAEGFNYMAMAGWKTQDMLDGIEGILSLAAASGEDLGTTSDIVTDALTAFGLQAKDSGHFADVLAAASSNANTNVGMLGESFKYVAPVAGAMKYSVEDVSLALGLMANASVKSSIAGTSLRSAIANLSAPTDTMKTAMDKYGISLTDSQGKMKTFKQLMDNMRKSLGNLSEAEQAAAAKNIFGKNAMAGMLTIINASEKDYNKLTKAINNADGASAEMADTMLDNLEGSITLFQSALDGVKLSFGKRLAPYVRDIADWLTDSMPAIEDNLENLMDWVDRKVDKLQAKFEKVSSGEDWINADFFGKARIAWDEFVAEPFIDWWSNTGKAKIASALGDFGSMLGTGLHSGIMTLLGLDVSDTLDEGVNIGKSFAKGFSEGFDFEAISSKLWEGLGNLVKNAGKLLPGGDSPEISSLLSAALLAKIASPLLSLGTGSVKLGSAIFGSGGTVGGTSLFSTLMGSSSAGTGLLGFGANTAISLGAGNLAEGASLSTGALSTIGLGATAGAIAGTAGLIHGGMDLYEGFTTDDEDKAKAYKTAGGIQVGGTLAGAGVGAAIGSVVPVVGTAAGALIGAGVGAIGSWIAGNNVKEDYEEDAEEAAKAAENAEKVFKVTGQSIDDVKFKTEALNKAMHDSEVSVEDFAEMYQESVAKNLTEHFGDVSLSLTEIKKIADDLVFSKQATKLIAYSEAATKTADSLSALESSMRMMEKENWKVSLGLKLDESEQDSYITAIDSYIQNAKTYVENQHYEATIALELILGKKGAKGITGDLDDTYGDLESKVNKYSNKLTKVVEKALEDGVVNAKEQKAITQLQGKIQNITDKMSTAEDQASLDALKIKYGNGTLDSDSFASMQEELGADTESAAQEYADALQTSLTSLELMGLNKKGKKYKRLSNEIQKEYEDKILALNDRSENFQLDMIAEQYSKELDGILPELDGTTQERLKTAMDAAFAIEPDVNKWETDDIIKWFGLDSLEGETAGAISSMLKMVAASIPNSVKDLQVDDLKDTVPTVEEIMDKVDFTKMTWGEYNKLTGRDTDLQMSNSGNNSGDDSFMLSGNEENASKSIENFSKQIHDYLESNLDPTEIQNFMKEYMNSAVSDVDISAADTVVAAGTATGNSIVNSASDAITSGSGILRNSLENCAAVAAEVPLTPNIQINPNYQITPFNLGSALRGSSGNNNKSTEKPAKNYNGGYASHRQLSWLAEEGWGEFVIPTNPSRRARALDLYAQAGRALGVGEHANGGFVTPAGDVELGSYADADDTQLYSADISGSDAGTSVTGNNIQIDVQVNPEFVIKNSEGQNEENITAVIKRHIREMADELGGEIATQLDDVFSNMPLEGV